MWLKVAVLPVVPMERVAPHFNAVSQHAQQLICYTCTCLAHQEDLPKAVLQGQRQALGISSRCQPEGVSSGHHTDSTAAEHTGLPAHWLGQDPHCSCHHAQLHPLVP